MSDLSPVFAELRSILAAYAARLEVTHDTPTEFCLDTRHVMKNKKPLFFGAVQTKKNYVSYHLMPVYVEPGLLDGISPELRKRMQGKSCFHFTVADKALFKELAALTKKGFAHHKARGYV